MSIDTTLMPKKKSIKERMKNSFRRYWLFYLLILPGVISVIIYSYGPMILQAVLAFTNYRFVDGIFGSEFVGFANFKRLFTEVPELSRLIKNTLIISFWSFICGFFPPLILAIILFDLKSNRLRKVSQTIVYIPYFFSWIIVYGLSYGILSNTGIINSIIEHFGGRRIEFLSDSRYIRVILMLTSIWKNVGWGTIIYLAAMQSIDTQLYDVAKIDGCGPIRRIFVVTLPGIRNVVLFLLVLSLGGLIGGGNTEQILLFYSPSTYERADTIGTWLYRIGLKTYEYSLGASLSFIQSTLAMILILIGNHISMKKAKVGIW